MPIKIRFFLILYFFINHSIKAEFVLASNNVNKVYKRAVGATGVVNGKTYTKVNRSTLQSMINGGQDVSCVYFRHY